MDWTQVATILATGLITGAVAILGARLSAKQQIEQLKAQFIAQQRGEELEARRDAFQQYLGLLSRFRSEIANQILELSEPSTTSNFRMDHDLGWAGTMLFASTPLIEFYSAEFLPVFNNYWSEISENYLRFKVDIDRRPQLAAESEDVFDTVLRPAILALADRMKADLVA